MRVAGWPSLAAVTKWSNSSSSPSATEDPPCRDAAYRSVFIRVQYLDQRHHVGMMLEVEKWGISLGVFLV
ncbi:hypothetical protein TNCV_1541901 [Trichonephila clavipes]|nr:hypothetical protein TNCV_1541901 [Trichonephila clavipes]